MSIKPLRHFWKPTDCRAEVRSNEIQPAHGYFFKNATTKFGKNICKKCPLNILRMNIAYRLKPSEKLYLRRNNIADSVENSPHRVGRAHGKKRGV